MARITRPLTNNEILKAKPREKDFTLHDGDGLFLLSKHQVKNYSASAISVQSVVTERIKVSALTLAAARQIRDQHLTTLAQGMDPQQQQEQASELRQIELDSIFSTVAATGSRLKARASQKTMRKIFGVLWIKTFSLLSARYLFRR
ncbi:integrase arm-type DNA-binding domain-containing protein [Brenneria uluponensis]|uniref:integrase arm-type DNA-binding domain-containing protein n=1 Tax=Brenneria uluponensis TaxID=3057057 RepID=UPI0031F313AB